MRTLSLAVTLAALLASGVHADSSEAERLEALEQRWLAASVAHDVATLRDLLADEFVDVSYQGTLRRKADLLGASAAPAKTRQALSELAVRLYGDAAVVTGVNTVTADDGSFTVRLRFTDVFAKQSGRWRAVSAQETVQKGS